MSELILPKLITPDWPAPENVRAVATTRIGGASEVPFDSLNLGDHVGDSLTRVQENRNAVMSALGLQSETVGWLQQVHSDRVVVMDDYQCGVQADASFACRPAQVCVVMTADCLPVLLCDSRGEQVAAVHAGWRGLANGVLERALDCFNLNAEIMAWLGPAIGPEAFEVGQDVYDAFCQQNMAASQAFTVAAQKGKWLADIYTLARMRLQNLGVSVYGGNYCTFNDRSNFFSYRRDGQTGRMASLIWIS